MCDDHAHARPGPTALTWGRYALFCGIATLTMAAILAWEPPLPTGIEALLRVSVGPILALAGWSLTHFFRSEVDSVTSRFAGFALVVGGALAGWTALAGGVAAPGPERALEQAAAFSWVGVGAVALGWAALRHPLFGRGFGWIGLAAGLATTVWAAYELAGTAIVSVWIHPLVLLLAWYSAILVRTAGAVRRMRRGYEGWPEPSLV